MRILFVGGLYRGYRLAQRLLERGADVVGAYVYEEDAHEAPQYADRIEALFNAAGVEVEKTRKITKARLPAIRDRMAPDVVFCLGWRTLIPMELLQDAPLGGVAVHDSLLPRLRGFAPTNWGMILGHNQLGATLFQITDSVDAGDVYFQEALTPDAGESYESIQEKIAHLSVRLFDQYLDAARNGRPVGRPQDQAAATYACTRSPQDGEIDWRWSCEEIERLINALGPPAPGAFTYHRGARLTVVEAQRLDPPDDYEGRIPGRIVQRNPSSGAVDILCGDGVLRLVRVRTEEGIVQPATSVLKSVRESLGLNYSEEIVSLRQRLALIESQLAALQPPLAVNRAG